MNATFRQGKRVTVKTSNDLMKKMDMKDELQKDRTVYIGRLQSYYPREELQAHFQQFGPLKGAHYSRNFALIDFESKDVRDAAIAGSQGLTIQE